MRRRLLLLVAALLERIEDAFAVNPYRSGRAPDVFEILDEAPILRDGDALIVTSIYTVDEEAGYLTETGGSVWVERRDGAIVHYPAGLKYGADCE